MDFARRLHPFRGMMELQNDQIPTKTTRMQAMSLKEILSTYWLRIQGELLPWLDDAMDGPLNVRHQQFVSVLGLARIETFLPGWHGLVGRPPAERAALARSFIAKAVFNLPTTTLLIDILGSDKTLRRLCGWQRAGEVPSESTFSRAFAEFAASALPSRLHDALIGETRADRLVGHISRDSTAIEAREKPVKSAEPKPPAQPKRKRGRPRKGEERPIEPLRRIERQLGMTVPAMLKDLPRHCDVGTKRNAKGQSGRNSALLRRSPLRTVRASFPAHGSRLFKAPYDRSRQFTFPDRTVDLTVAVGVKEHEIGSCVRSTVCPRDDVVNFPPDVLRNRLATDRAFAVLRLPKLWR